jgi:hypothetical protein
LSSPHCDHKFCSLSDDDDDDDNDDNDDDDDDILVSVTKSKVPNHQPLGLFVVPKLFHPQ